MITISDTVRTAVLRFVALSDGPAMFKARLSTLVKSAAFGPSGGGGIVINLSDRVRGRVGQAKNGLSEEDYSVRRMIVEYMRFNMIGALNVLFFFTLNHLFNWLDLSPVKSLSVWAPSWLIGALEAHAAHRWITFRSNAAYKESLMWAGIVYGVTAVMSTTSVYLLYDLYGVDYWVAWAMNTVTFGFITFLGLRYLAFPPSQDAVEEQSAKVSFHSADEVDEMWNR